MNTRSLASLVICAPLLASACTITVPNDDPQGHGGATPASGGNAAKGGAGSTAKGGAANSNGGSEDAAGGEGGAGSSANGGNAGSDTADGGNGGSSAKGGSANNSAGGAPASGGGSNTAQGGSTTTGGGTGNNSGNGGSAGGADPPATTLARFFLSTPAATNTVAPKVVVDTKGGVHAAYPAYAGGRAFYAYCAKNCSDPSSFRVAELNVGASIANVALAVNAEGKPRLVLSEFNQAYYASCDTNCTTSASWKLTPVYDHQNDMEVTGQALALDAQGHPRFLMHTYVALLGIGQKTPQTLLASCNAANCNDAAAWSFDTIADKIWQYPEIRIDAKGRTHVVTGEVAFVNNVPSDKIATYYRCDANCASPSAWTSVQLAILYEDTVVKPSISLALTPTGDPRVALLIKDEDVSTPDTRFLAYAECNGTCAFEDWSAVLISQNKAIRSGVSLALDGLRPRVAFTLDYNIGIYQCDTDCTNSDWALTEVEFAKNLPADDIFLFPGCSAGAWFLDSPSISIAPDRSIRVGYRAYDVSGSTRPPLDPSKPRCKTGIDFTWSRLATLPAQ